MIDRHDMDAGEGQRLVVFSPADSGTELDPLAVFGAVADEAKEQARKGLDIVAMTTMPLRHSGLAIGRTGSGFQTKIAVAVVYAPVKRGGG